MKYLKFIALMLISLLVFEPIGVYAQTAGSDTSQNKDGFSGSGTYIKSSDGSSFNINGQGSIKTPDGKQINSMLCTR